MKATPFTRHVPKTVAEAVSLLADFADNDGRILAGGQSLVPMMAFRLARPLHLIDINEIVGLDIATIDNGRLAIGALVRHGAFHRPIVAGPLGKLLMNVAGNIAHYPIRMRGTMCGSLAHADPASEWCLTAVTLDAELIARNTGGERVMPARTFFEGIMSTGLKEDDLLVQARFPLLPVEIRFGFCEFNRRAGDFALAASLVAYRLEDGRVRDARIGVGGAEPVPRRVAAAEAVIENEPVGADAFRQAARAAADALEPIEDHQIDAPYRRRLVEAVVQRALEQTV